MKQVFLSKILFRVRKGDTLDDIAQIFDVTKEYILMHNNIENECLEEGSVIFLPQSNVKIHVVQPLENIESIAQKYGISQQKLRQFNNVDSVFIGQKILIP